MKKLILFVGFCSCLLGATYTAASCSASDIQAAIKAEQVSPADGDIISIPAGTCNWSGSNSVTATFSHSITIQGAGAVYSTAGGVGTAGTDQTIINDGNGALGIMTFTAVAGKSFRFTGIALLSTVANNGILYILGSSSAVRVDHCHFYVTNVGLYIGGSTTGVADHNFYDAPANSIINSIAFHNGQGWNGLSDPYPTADPSWADTDHFGTIQFFYAEDSRFNGDIGDAHDGARYVIRYSSAQSTNTNGHGNQMYNHGLTDARGRATRAAEVYMNTFVQPGNTGVGNPLYSINSGTLLFWGNTITQYLGAVQLDYTRKNNATYTYAAIPNGWGYCGTASGPSNWDKNNNSLGYPCLDQAGRGIGDLLNGQNFPNALDSVKSTITWPNQVLDPIYAWGNAYTTSGGYNPTTMVSSATSLYTDNVDYYQQFGLNAETGTFNGSRGVGQGLYSALPSTCTAGVGYWATDQNTLYVCGPTVNTWEAYYAPYTYPHPLTGGGNLGPSSPTNLVAASQ
jgi:hypothetical protein